ncbi:MAG: encapsulin, partial [Cyanobacteria bacterium NC_groundwater_1444_Ag_S-0.65um_54_12]|nr:encapsulin [Cyanobacteria bacterium NC_groundwater_1444_Ag_S-0.65um_54_12]
MKQSFLNREESPLNTQDWEQIDNTIVESAKRVLTGRRFLPIFGPLGVGIQDVDYDIFTGTAPAQLAIFGETETSVVRAERRVHENIPLLYKDFVIYWRDIETA